MSEQTRIPQHVALIMDGNGRWAELRGKERYEGHVAGVEPVRASLRAAAVAVHDDGDVLGYAILLAHIRAQI